MQSNTHFTSFVEQHGPAAFGLVRKMLHKNPGVIDDVYQNALILAYRNWGRVRDEGARKSWFMQIVVNEVRAEVRSWQFIYRKSEVYFGSTLDIVEAVADIPHGGEADSVRQLDMSTAIDTLRTIIRKHNDPLCLDAVINTSGRGVHISHHNSALRTRYFRWRNKVKRSLEGKGFNRECYTLDR